MSNSRRSKTVLKVLPFRATDGTPAASRETEALFMVSELQRFSKANFVGNALLVERKRYFLEAGCRNRFGSGDSGIKATTARVRVTTSFHSAPDYTMACADRGSAIFCRDLYVGQVGCLLNCQGGDSNP